jgi:uncharacterized membrane protein
MEANNGVNTVGKKAEWIFWIILLLPFLYIPFIWDKLPESVPTHWNAKGEIDDYSSRLFGTFLVPVMNIALYFLFLVLPKIDPRKKNYPLFGNAYWYIRLTIASFMMVMFFITINTAMGYLVLNPKIIIMLVLLLLAVLGNFMRTIRSNFFVGIRTPWTLDNPEVWKKTHEHSGRIWFYASLACLLILIFIPEQYMMWVFIPFIILISVYPVVYSYLIFRKLNGAG